MITFLKAQASSLIATAVDFLTTILLVEIFTVWYLPASVTGTITGGVANFMVNRVWVFEATDERTTPQAMKYFLVWTGNLGLNAGGLFLMTTYSGFSYLVSKILVSAAVGFSYNYVLQKKFVFR